MAEYVNGWKKKSDKVGSYYECPACGFRIGKDPEVHNHCPGCGADLLFILRKREKKSIRKGFPYWVSVKDRLPEATIEVFYEEGGKVFRSEPLVVTGYDENGKLVLDVAQFYLDEDVEGGYWLETRCSGEIAVIYWLDNLTYAPGYEAPREDYNG